jgi:hypothetical protein
LTAIGRFLPNALPIKNPIKNFRNFLKCDQNMIDWVYNRYAIQTDSLNFDNKKAPRPAKDAGDPGFINHGLAFANTLAGNNPAGVTTAGATAKLLRNLPVPLLLFSIAFSLLRTFKQFAMI